MIFRECLGKVEAITEQRPLHDHALPTNCIIIIWLPTGIYSCYFSVMWVACCQSKTDSNLMHRTILQFLLVPIMYPGSPSQSEHSWLQYPFSVLKLYAACFGWPSIHTYCSLHFHLSIHTGSREGNTGMPYRLSKLMDAYFLHFAAVSSAFIFQDLFQKSRSSFRDLCID